MERRRALGILLAATGAVGYGIGPFFARDAYRAGIGWPELLAWRFVIAAALTWALVLCRPVSREALVALDRRRAGIVMATGAIFTVNGIAYYAAVQVIPASLAALIMSMHPALVAVLATRIGHVPAGPRPWIALAATLSGAALLIGGVQAGSNPAGIALAILAPTAYAVYTVLGARVAGERRGVTAVGRSGGSGPDLDSAVAAAFLLSGTALGTLLVTAVVGVHAAPWEMPGAAWPGILGVAVFATAIAMQAGYAGVARIGSSLGAIVMMLEPVTTVLLAMVLLGEQFGPGQLAGGAIIVAGVAIALSANLGSSERSECHTAGRASAGEPTEPFSAAQAPSAASLAAVPARTDSADPA